MPCHASQKNKIQTEAFNNSNTIDIIGIDVGKEPAIPIKEQNNINQITQIGEKPTTNILQILEHNQSLISYNEKHVKDMYSQYKVLENHNCAICGEGFNYITALAQHYLHQHKGYDPLQKNYGPT